MRKFLLLYTGLALSANAGLAGALDPGLMVGAMQKLMPEAARPLPETGLTDLAGAPQALSQFRGRWLVVNFWATWCMPCREEMPSLDRLQAAMPDLAVVAVATGPNPQPAVDRFLAEAQIGRLAVWRDPDQALAHGLGVMGLPVTMIVNPEGAVVARLIGGAEWDGPEARAVLAALMAP